MLAHDFPGLYLYNAVKLDVFDINGLKHSASGFWFTYNINGFEILTLVTAGHVFKNYSSAIIRTCQVGLDGFPADKSSCEITLEASQIDELLIRHKIDDLCCLVFKINGEYKIDVKGRPFIFSLSNKDIFDFENSIDYMLLQNVIMIGCPDRIYDSVNNKPIAKQGVTASPIKFDFEGKRQYLVDISCQHGSSGSPLFLYSKGTYFQDDALLPGNFMKLIGIFLGGWEEFAEQPDNIKATVNGEETSIKLLIPNGIGYVLKPVALNELLEYIKERFLQFINLNYTFQ